MSKKIVICIVEDKGNFVSMVDFNVAPFLTNSSNSKAKIKLPDGEYIESCGTSKPGQPNDRGVGVLSGNADEEGQRSCHKLGFVVLESNETKHFSDYL